MVLPKHCIVHQLVEIFLKSRLLRAFVSRYESRYRTSAIWTLLLERARSW